MNLRRMLVAVLALFAIALSAAAQERPGDRMLAEYFKSETAKLREQVLDGDWQDRDALRKQLAEMLGLDPLPERTPLEPVVTGVTELDEIVIEKLHFQSRPGLYVTANFYRPKTQKGPLPAILYVCGHAQVKKDGVSFGNKAGYHHHGAWFARNGYVCLTIDTLQLGEMEGIHHGTYRHDRWWWNSRGYTPAGVEAWNGMRAIDYLQSRSEVAAEKIGITGRSGGGAYSWYVAAMDERVKVAVPVAGITDLENHIVDGCVEGHCDCMYMVNTYRWDYPRLVALLAPRPLLISNTDKDGIFPLDGVVRTHAVAQEIYKAFNAEKNLGLQITEGPHEDTQELRIHAFVWFDRFLKGEKRVLSDPAEKFLEPEQLKVFSSLPSDQVNARVDEVFVPIAPEPVVPESADAWSAMRDRWIAGLTEKTFRGWPTGERGTLSPVSHLTLHNLTIERFDLTSSEPGSRDQAPLRLPLYTIHREGLGRPSAVHLHVLDEQSWDRFAASFGVDAEGEPRARDDSAATAFSELKSRLKMADEVAVFLAPRGIGPGAWTEDPKERTHIRRRFMLLGQTLDGMRAWDVRCALQAIRARSELRGKPVTISGTGDSAIAVLYASLFEPEIAKLELTGLPASHQTGPDLLNVLRVLDVPQAVAMAAERCPVSLHSETAEPWKYPQSVAEQLGWSSDRVTIVPLEEAAAE